jgi:hypothetical protein
VNRAVPGSSLFLAGTARAAMVNRYAFLAADARGGRGGSPRAAGDRNVPGVGLEMERADVVEQLAGRAQPGPGPRTPRRASGARPARGRPATG